MGKKRQVLDRPTWDEYFMLQAVLAGTRASCEFVYAGAVIVKDKRVIATGYNGAPPGVDNCLDLGCRKEREGIEFGEKNTGWCIGEHAERNALLQISREESKNSTMYYVLYPCTDCSKQIVGARINELVYLNVYKEPSSLTKEIFDKSGVKVRKMELDLGRMTKFIGEVINQKK
jgi:dCMP deaminase